MKRAKDWKKRAINISPPAWSLSAANMGMMGAHKAATLNPMGMIIHCIERNHKCQNKVSNGIIILTTMQSKISNQRT
jgi:hypothetical protein